MLVGSIRRQASRLFRAGAVSSFTHTRALCAKTAEEATKEAAKPAGGGRSYAGIIFALAGAGGGAILAKQMGYLDGLLGGSAGPGKPDYDAVRKAIADIMDVEDYDDGSYGPVLVRLAWHSSGTFDKHTNTGGSKGATMRFSPECDHGANAGLAIARDLLEPIKKQFPWISYADLYTLGGVVAVEEMGGPVIPWRPGRGDVPDGSSCPPDGRLPDGNKEQSHLRDIFYRMGFDDQEIVALTGAHTLGRCHGDRSGFVGPWTNAPTTFSNLFFVELTGRKWQKKPGSSPMQYEDKESKSLMMLPADMALINDKKFKKYVDVYSKDEAKFFEDFSAAFSKLLELGVDLPKTA